MANDHDLIRHCSYLHQGLAQDKRPLGVFMGAGCPCSIMIEGNGRKEPLIPDMRGLTTAIYREIQKNKATNIILTKAHTQVVGDGTPNPNIEDILSHVRALRIVAGKETVRDLSASDLDSIDRTICDCINKLVSRVLPETQTAYDKFAKWVGAIRRSVPVEIFTTNYDLLIEQALERYRVPYFDGFIGSDRAFFDPNAMEDDILPARWARLWKLHGSINWRQDASGVVSRGEREIEGKERRVIHPSHLKYEESRQMPFLAMFDRLKAFLKNPSAVFVICGYSFGDEHLNATILQGLRGNPSTMAFALLYGKVDNYGKAMTIASSLGNLSLLAEDAGVIGTRNSHWDKVDGRFEQGQYVGIECGREKKVADGEVSPPTCTLGDFANFGRFLDGLIGVRSETEGGNGAE